MPKTEAKIIDAVRVRDSHFWSYCRSVIERAARVAGLTQSELAAGLKLDKPRSRKSKTAATPLSSLKKYVEALGATLRIDAAFDAESGASSHIGRAFDVDFTNDDQLVFPILGDEIFRPKRDVVLSVRPLYSAKIFSGMKTVELRRRFPLSAPRGTIAYIYSTSPIRAMVGSTEISSVNKLSTNEIWAQFGKQAQISKFDFEKYFEGLVEGVAIVISDARAFSRPIDLAELRDRFGFEPPQSFLQYDSLTSGRPSAMSTQTYLIDTECSYRSGGLSSR